MCVCVCVVSLISVTKLQSESECLFHLFCLSLCLYLIYLLIPDWATTQDKRKNNITPQMLRRQGMNTPWIQPSLIPWVSPVSGGLCSSMSPSCENVFPTKCTGSVVHRDTNRYLWQHEHRCLRCLTHIRSICSEQDMMAGFNYTWDHRWLATFLFSYVILCWQRLTGIPCEKNYRVFKRYLMSELILKTVVGSSSGRRKLLILF